MSSQDTVVDKLLKKYNIVKYKGKLIVPDEKTGLYYVSGRVYGSFEKAQKSIEKSRRA